MCGIVGYIGKNNATLALINGIKMLEYRGYDSAGIAVISESGDLKVEKTVGRVAELEKKINGGADFEGRLGICHSRWATHGKVSQVNAHPHSDCTGNIWLVHNGIIENYRELKDEFLNANHKFVSETDTEVIAHLIEEMKIREPKLSLEDAVLKVLKLIKGTYGLAIIDKENPAKLVAVRNFSPIVLGVGEGEYLVASDAAAVLRYTRKVIYLRDGELAVLKPSGHKILTFDNKSIERDFEEIDWTVEQAKKGGYPHLMLKEIFEQPAAILNSLRGRLLVDDGISKLGGLESVKDKLRSKARILIAACGTSYFAGRIGEYILEEYGGIPTEIDLSSEFRYRKPLLNPKSDLFLVISQSGETADTLAALQEAKQHGLLSLGIVNVVGSSIARATDAGTYQHVGPEVSVASTKAFTSQIGILTLLSLYLGRQRELSLVLGQRIAKELLTIPSLMEQVLRKSELIRKIAKKYQKFNNFLYLGRKYNLPVALEGALKLKEISYVHAEGMSVAEMKHGTIALIDKDFPSIVIVPADSVYDKVRSNIEEIKARGGPVVAIATEGNQEIKHIADDVIFIPKTLEMLTPMLSVIPLQLFAYHFAALRGLDIDKPRNLAKSVTVE